MDLFLVILALSGGILIWYAVGWRAGDKHGYAAGWSEEHAFQQSHRDPSQEAGA